MNTLETALYDLLSGTSAITDLLASATGIYNQKAPRGAAYPLIIFNEQGGPGDENKSPHRSRNLLYTIKAITQTNLSDAGDIDEQIDAVLHLQILIVSGWSNFWLAREGPIRLVETTPEGQEFYHSGGIYRIRIAQ